MDELYIESPKTKRLRSSSRQPKKVSKSIDNKRKRGATPASLPNTVNKRIKKKSTNIVLSSSTHRKQSLQGSGVIPPWQTLPYEILVQILIYASYPLHDDFLRSTPNVKWLHDMSLLCKSWSEPALTALYRCPPLDDPHGLTSLLSMPSTARSINYNAKVQRLDIDVSRTLAYTIPGFGHFDLGSLVRQTPQLRDLALYHNADHPKLRKAGVMAKPGKWTYQDTLFRALAEARIQLRSWRWNTRMISPKQTLSLLKDVHQMVPFRRLQALTFVNFNPATRRNKADPTTTDEQHLAAALSVLPDIEQLVFDSCTVTNQGLFPNLPLSIRKLTIQYCSELTSEVFHPFLITHGRLLKELVLDHNQSLNLSFLADLAVCCPQLEVLKMDLLYYNSHYTFRDSEPKYEDLLVTDEVPTWPSTLQTLDLVQLRNWDASTAEMFFQSLIDSAPNLPHLRRLVLKAILKIGWRDRASFRDKWIGRLQRVFLRPVEPPRVHTRATGVHRIYNDVDETEDIGHVSQVSSRSERGNHKSVRNSDARRVLRRRSSQTSVFSHVEIHGKDDTDKSDSDVPIVPKRRSKRIIEKEEDEYALPASPEMPIKRPQRRPRVKRSNASGSSEASDSDTGHEIGTGTDSGHSQGHERFIQGMCEVVEVRIDNLRPTEEQLNENDFLDDEISGDEDWVGEDTVHGDTAYAW